MRRNRLRLRSLLATAAEPLTPIATIFVGSFQWSADVGLGTSLGTDRRVGATDSTRRSLAQGDDPAPGRPRDLFLRVPDGPVVVASSMA